VLDSLFPSRSVADIAHELGSSVGPLPLIGINYEAGRRMFRGAGMELGAVRNRTGTTTPMQGVTFAVAARAHVETAMVPNVVAYLPGSDPALRDEFVVYSAHFDHLGVGAPDAAGDSIYSGADDNASGTSAVLAISRAFAALPQPPARSVMFVLVSAEEIGLVGSRHFVENPPVPVERMVANINADMIGRNAPDTVVAIGQEFSSLGPAVQAIVARRPDLGLVVAPDLWPEEQLFFRSDHFSFAAQGIPAIFFTTGLHEQYHQPSDRVEIIDTDKLARISRLLFLLGHDVASTPERPHWTERGLSEVRSVTGGSR
jgi:Zn-dependent M28 family amino/carboxypeptidase